MTPAAPAALRGGSFGGSRAGRTRPKHRSADVADAIRYGGIRDELGAAVAELRHLGRYLAWASAGEGDALSRAEHRLGLADSGERIGEQVAALAGELEAALAALPAE